MKKSQAVARRPRLDAGAWARLLAGQEKSGQSVKEYCAAQGISAASYYRWQKLLKEEEEVQAQFHPIEIQAKPMGGIVVELPGGVKLHFSELPPVAYLRSLSSSFSGGSI
ncbi:MAG: transposase [Phaeodactylibacter sp.]|nr:transposase [Phaeodactylibacter sp.]